MFGSRVRTEMKITSHAWASSEGVEHAMPPMAWSGSPRDIVRFQYLRDGRDCDWRCFWRFKAIARPIEPRPIQPRRRVVVVDIFEGFGGE